MQLAIAARIDARAWEDYYVRADAILRSCAQPEGKP
jgi:hypothetical protein